VPHVGNIRTALFSYLLARHHGGQFILRLEDTDRARLVPESIPAISESLRWLGLDYAEGPDIGGPYAPYTQSERLDQYQAAARRLIEQGDAYECWCSSGRLDAVRAEQQRLKQPPQYDRRCREEAGRAQSRREAEEDGRNPVVRFKTPREGSVTLEDPIHGSTTFDVATLDDFVMLKSDGYPTYHLAYIVDDDAMAITHVIRGDEWIPSAPRHLLIYRALGIEPPVLAHAPRILGPDGAKLSKRHGATSVFEYRDEGYLPEALFNFLGLVGWSLDDKTEILSKGDFIKHFSLDRVVKNPAIFNVEKLQWMNGVYIREVISEPTFADLVAERLEQDLPASVLRPIDRGLVSRIAPLLRERIKLLSEVAGYCEFFFHEELKYSKEDLLGKAYSSRPDAAKVALASAAVVVGDSSWDHTSLEASLRELASQLGAKAGDLFALIRVAVTGKRITPPLFESMELLGRDRCASRLAEAGEML
jgi:glutamyl-tRNA synthetase